MILSKYIIYKFASALTITLTAFFSLFYIGSLIDNLILDLNFVKISLITFLDSVSIIVIVPEIIFFFTVLLFCLIVRTSNELIIIRHYLNKKKLSIIFLIFVSFCYAISINKTLILDSIDVVKYNISSESNDKIIKNKILEDNKEKNKIFYELININLKDHVIGNLKIHNFENNIHIQTLVSNDVRYDEERISLESFTIITKDNIYKSSVKQIFNIKDFEGYLLSNESVRYIKNSFSDAFDADFSKLKIENLKISTARNDCTDFSAGNYELVNLELKSCGDKAVSIGEKSKVIIKNIEVDLAEIGLAVKDSSIMSLNNANLTNLKTCVAAYKKKQEFNGGFVELNNFNCGNFQKMFEKDKLSKIILNDKVQNN